MKRYIYSLFATIISMVCLSGCISDTLNDVDESFDGADITGIVGVYYRYINADGNVQQIRLSTGAEIDNEENTMEIVYLVPANFPADQVDKVTTSNLVVVLNISTAAVIKPLGDAPKLGVPGDWSKVNQYEVTAANGTKKIWTITLGLYTGD